jgi:hypothetical protein
MDRKDLVTSKKIQKEATTFIDKNGGFQFAAELTFLQQQCLIAFGASMR